MMNNSLSNKTRPQHFLSPYAEGRRSATYGEKKSADEFVCQISHKWIPILSGCTHPTTKKSKQEGAALNSLA